MSDTTFAPSEKEFIDSLNSGDIPEPPEKNKEWERLTFSSPEDAFTGTVVIPEDDLREMIDYAEISMPDDIRVLMRRDYLERERSTEAIDPTTGLYDLTSSKAREVFHSAMEHMERDEDNNAFFLYFDIDGLKPANTLFGHAGGDELLSAFGAAFHETFRSAEVDSSGKFPEGRDIDITFREGKKGDEFGGVLFNITKEQVTERMKLLSDNFEKELFEILEDEDSEINQSFDAMYRNLDPMEQQELMKKLPGGDYVPFTKGWRQEILRNISGFSCGAYELKRVPDPSEEGKTKFEQILESKEAHDRHMLGFAALRSKLNEAMSIPRTGETEEERVRSATIRAARRELKKLKTPSIYVKNGPQHYAEQAANYAKEFKGRGLARGNKISFITNSNGVQDDAIETLINEDEGVKGLASASGKLAGTDIFTAPEEIKKGKQDIGRTAFQDLPDYHTNPQKG